VGPRAGLYAVVKKKIPTLLNCGAVCVCVRALPTCSRDIV